MNGLKQITEAFGMANVAGRAALMPYFTLGFPNPRICVNIIVKLAKSGADLIELGVPFSDPLADGPTIQHSTQQALDQGMTVARCMDMLSEIRARGVACPLLLMGYINPILAYGVERYVRDAHQCGADGLIVPDLPLEEAQGLESLCRQEGIAFVYLAAPTSTPDRLVKLAEHTTGFLYLVSVAGVTGARAALSDGLADFTERVRRIARTPLAIGFGISDPQQAQTAGRLADGVIIGSALIQRVADSEDPEAAAGEFIREIRAGMQVHPAPAAEQPSDALSV